MKKITLKILLFSIILFTSCKKEITDLEFEKSVMSEIYPSLIDSTWICNKISLTIPKIKLTKNKKNIIGFELNDVKKLKEIYNQELSQIKKDTTKILVIIIDKIRKTEHNSGSELQKHFKNITLDKKNYIDTLEYKIDQKEISLIKNLKVKFVTDFKMSKGIWGIVEFSRIKFDKEKNFGTLSSSITRGAFNRIVHRIYIKKLNNKWIIEKVEATLIS